MSTTTPLHPWSKEALFAKSLLFVGRMEASPPNSSEYGIWSSLALELLARAALSNISPVLLADEKNWRHFTYALGSGPTSKKFFPASIPTKEVLIRLNELAPTFVQEIVGFCSEHIGRRNAELHTGEMIFDLLGTSHWLPKFYSACKVLLALIGKTLPDYVADPREAESMIATLNDEAARAVMSDIAAHAKVWSSKGAVEKEKAVAQATAWATRQLGHRVECPACKTVSLLMGDAIGTVATEISGDEVIQRQKMLPAAFECIACSLRILGLSKLSAANLGDVFVNASTYSAAEYFNLFTEDDIEEARAAGPEYEEDHNE